MTAETVACRTCGASFTASRTGRTVNCPAHRGRTTRFERLGIEHGTIEAVYAGCTCTACLNHLAHTEARLTEFARRAAEARAASGKA